MSVTLTPIFCLRIVSFTLTIFFSSILSDLLFLSAPVWISLDQTSLHICKFLFMIFFQHVCLLLSYYLCYQVSSIVFFLTTSLPPGPMSVVTLTPIFFSGLSFTIDHLLLFNLNLFFLHTVWISLTKHSLHTLLFISFPAFFFKFYLFT